MNNYTFTYRGYIARENDIASFTSSDGVKNIGRIKKRKDDSLYFWNITHDIKDYKNLVIEKNVTSVNVQLV